MMEVTETLKQSFGRRLKAARKAAGFSAETVAKELKIHSNTIYQLERGEQWISAEMLERLCVFLAITPDRLFSDKEPQPTPIEALQVLSEALGGKGLVAHVTAKSGSAMRDVDVKSVSIDTPGGPFVGAMAADPDLQRIIEAWGKLDKEFKRGLVDAVGALEKAKDRGLSKKSAKRD